MSDRILLLQARYVLRALNTERPGCGYGKLSEACDRAAWREPPDDEAHEHLFDDPQLPKRREYRAEIDDRYYGIGNDPTPSGRWLLVAAMLCALSIGLIAHYMGCNGPFWSSFHTAAGGYCPPPQRATP